MGQHADDYNDFQAQSCEDLLDYESGSIDKLEAIERGVLDENGCYTQNVTVWGVHDVESLVHELDVLSLMFRSRP